MEQKVVEKAAEIISAEPLNCVLALMDLDGYPTASTIMVSKNDGIKWLTFCTMVEPNKKRRIDNCNRASVCFFSTEPLYNISLVGKIEVITDQKIKEEMWYEGLEHHFSGHDDENYCVLKFVTERYNLFVGYEEATGKM
jgi:general stress protein 26